MMILRDHLLASIGSSATHGNYGLTTLVKLVLLLLLYGLSIVYAAVAVDNGLRIIVCIILHIALVANVLVQGLFGSISKR